MDGLKGFADAIKTAYPGTEVRDAGTPDKILDWYAKGKEGSSRGPQKHLAENYLQEFADVIRTYRRVGETTYFFKYPEKIRNLIYTTNPIERDEFRELQTTREFSHLKMEKILYLKISKILEKWKRMPVKDWSNILSQLMIYFEDKISDWKYLIS